MFLKKMMTGLSVLAISGMAMAANPLSTKLTDPVIVKTVMNVNEGEISLAQLATKKATNPEVKSFAEEMIKEHTTNNQEAKDLTKKFNIEPMANMKTEAKTLSAEKNMAMLKMKDGKSFDKAYMEAQVNMHKKVLEDLNQNLIPAAKNEELKAMLTKTATSVREHLEHAQSIQNKML